MSSDTNDYYLNHYPSYGLFKEPKLERQDKIVEYSTIDYLEKSQNFFKQAESDLLDAKCLYKCNRYSSTAFHLQQSFEKAVKSLTFCLMAINMDYTEKKIEDKKHRTTKLIKDIDQMAINSLKNEPDPYYKVLFEVLQSSIISEYPSIEPLLENDQLWNIADSVSTNINIDSGKFDKFLKDLNSANLVIKKYKKFTLKTLSDDQLRELTYLNVDAFLEANPTRHYRMKGFRRRAFRRVNRVARAGLLDNKIQSGLLFLQAKIILSGLAIVTESHALARYPYGDFIPLNFYNKDTPIIKNFKMIYSLANDAYASLEKIVDGDVSIMANMFI